MKIKKQKNKKILLILVLLVGLVIGAAFLVNAFYQPTKTYHSKFLKITIDYPTDFELEERFGTITLKNTKGEIAIGANGTNYETVDEYLDYLSKVNKVSIINRQHILINELDSVKATIKHPKSNNPDREVYYFYINNGIHDVSTKDRSLYPELDRVAKSFRYEP